MLNLSEYIFKYLKNLEVLLDKLRLPLCIRGGGGGDVSVVDSRCAVVHKFSSSRNQKSMIYFYKNIEGLYNQLTHIIPRGTVVPQPFKAVYKGQI